MLSMCAVLQGSFGRVIGTSTNRGFTGTSTNRPRRETQEAQYSLGLLLKPMPANANQQLLHVFLMLKSPREDEFM